MRTPSTGLGRHPNTTANTKALWVIDKGAGNTIYDIVNGRDATDVGGATWVPGLIGKAVNTTLRGFTDTVTAVGTDSAFVLGTWTVEAWVRTGAFGSGGSILAYDDGAAEEGLNLRIIGGATSDTNKVEMLWLGAGVIFTRSNSKIRNGVWTHVAAVKTFNASTGNYSVNLYINGVLDVAAGVTNANACPASSWKVGTDGGAATFAGEISSVHVTRDQLTAAQIRANWRRGMGWQNASETGHGNTYLDVYVSPPVGGASYLMSSIALTNPTLSTSFDFMHSISIVESVDNQCDTATLTLKREIYEMSLAPTMVGSPLNLTPPATIFAPGPDSQSASTLLGIGGSVTIFARRVPDQFNDPNQVAVGNGALIFQGTIDAVDWASAAITVECIDQGAALVDTYLETEVAYNTPNLSSTVEAGMQTVINAGMAAPPTLYVPESPGWTIGPWKQRRESVMQAIQTLADQIGYLVKYRWDPVTGANRLTLYNPEREEARFDGVITSADYTQITRIAQALTNVRNVVRISFLDSAQPMGRDADGNTTYAPNSEDVTDAASIALYGRRFFECAESATSNIDTVAEAITMGQSILDDLKTPDTNADMDVPYWEIEVGDRLLFEENGTTWDTPQTLCVVSKTSLFQSGLVLTNLQMKEARASGVQKHLVKEAGPGRSLPPMIDPARAGVDFGRRGYFAPIQGLMEAAQMMQSPPSLAGVQNPAMIVHPSVNQGPPTGWEIDGTWGNGALDDAFWSSTSETGDRSLALKTVGVEATSWWMPVAGGRSYQALCHWQADHIADQLDLYVDFYDANRAATVSHAVFTLTPDVINTWQCDGGIVLAGTADRWCRIRLQKTAGPTILIDRVDVAMMGSNASVLNVAPAAFGAGTTAIKWTNELFDYDDIYDVAAGEFTIAVPGLYGFDVSLSCTAPAAGGTFSFITIDMQVNGATVHSASYLPSSAVTNGSLWLHAPPILLDRADVVTFDFVFPAAVSVTATTGHAYRTPLTER